MSIEFLLSIISFVVILILGIPIAYTIGISGLFYFILKGDLMMLTMVPRKIFNATNVFVLAAAPLFILTGYIMNQSGMAKRLVTFADMIVGRFRGGLGQVNVMASIFFAGMTGSAISDTAAIGSILIPPMKQQGYDAPFSAAVTAGSSIIGPIIPPSCIMVIYGGIMSTSIAGLFAGGMLPGLLVGLLEMVYVAYISKKRNYPVHKEKLSRRQIITTVRESILSLLMPVFVMGSILAGIATPTEAAAIAVAYSLIISMAVFKSLKINDIPDILLRAGKTTAQLLFLIGCASIYAWVLAIEQVPQIVAGYILSISASESVILLLMCGIALILGCFMEITAALLLLAPIFGPIILATDIHPIQVGVALVIAFLIGIDTPPVGICLFGAASIAEIKLEQIVREIVPFLVICILVVVFVIYFPFLTLTIPRLFGLIY